MTRLVAKECGCVDDTAMGQKRPERCDCGNRLLTEAQLNPKPRKPLARVSERNREKVRKQGGSTLKQGRGFAVVPAQRKKVEGLPCVGCGKVATEFVAIDPAHIWSEGCRCTSPLCIIPLCRALDYSCHRLYDKRDLDLLSKLIDAGYYAELGHVIEAHEVSPLTLVERTTGQRYAPVEGVAA